MEAQTIRSVVHQLSNAGLNVSLASGGRLAVTPSASLSDDLRELIRSNKKQLIDWLTAANDADAVPHDLPDDSLTWRELAAAYYRHHFSCAMCVGAGRGGRYGERCGIGTTLWTAYRDKSESTTEGR